MMRIYPPFKQWKTEIKNSESFFQFLKENIETNNSNHKAVLKGKLNEKEFLVERKLFSNNTARPQIKGEIIRSKEGGQVLNISIERHKVFFYFMAIICLLIIILSVFNSLIFALIIIPVFLAWFYLTGFILHSLELGKTKIELFKILEKAKND